MPDFHSRTQSILIGIPAFNAEKTLPELVLQISSYSLPIVICDDGSRTPVKQLKNIPSCVRVITHTKNQGKAAALRSLYQHATDTGASALLIMDADGQHAPESITDFLAAHKNKADSFLIGNRFKNKEHIPTSRCLAIRCADFFLTCITRSQIEDSQCGMRLIPRDLFPHLLADTSQGFVAETHAIIIAKKNGYSLQSIPIPAIYPQRYTSHFRTIRDTIHIAAHLALYFFRLKDVTNNSSHAS